MTRRYMLAALGLVTAAGAATLYGIHSQPMVDEEVIQDARDEVERARVALNDVTCERPPIFGDEVDTALPLAEFLSATGPFSACWNAARDPALADLLEPVEESAGTEHRPYDANALPVPVAEVLEHCSALPDEVARQARTPNRCSPYPPSSEVSIEQSDYLGLLGVAQAVQFLARRLSLEDADAALRLLTQGMAVLTDAGNGFADTVQSMASVAAQERLMSTFLSTLAFRNPSSVGRVEIEAALDALETTSIDAHAFVAGFYIGVYDAESMDPLPAGQSEESRLLSQYLAATVLSAAMEACPPATEPNTCSELIRDALGGPMPDVGWLDELLLGSRARMPLIMAVAHEVAASGPRVYLRRLKWSRTHLRILKRLLQWTDDRQNGRCPEASEGEWGGGTETRVYSCRGASDCFAVVPYEADWAVPSFFFFCPMRN